MREVSDTTKLQALYDAASRLLDEKHRLCLAKDEELIALRKAIWQALRHLRTGRVEQARLGLEQIVKEP